MYHRKPVFWKVVWPFGTPVFERFFVLIFLFIRTCSFFPPLFFYCPIFSIHRSCRGGTSFLCRQRKDAKRAQRGESCFPPLNPLQGRGGGSSKLAREVCRLTKRRPPAQIAGIPLGVRLHLISSYPKQRTKQKKSIEELACFLLFFYIRRAEFLSELLL